MSRAEQIHGLLSHIPGDDSFNLNDIECIWELGQKVPEGATVLEIGSRFGRSACSWALAIKNSTVYTMDVHDNREKIREYAKKIGLEGRVIPLWGNSFKYPWIKDVDIVFIDGDHDYNAVMLDLKKYYPLIKTLICGHDYFHPEFPDVKKAVDEFFFNRKQRRNIWHAWKAQPLVVCGIPRTGTTIVANVLKSHPEINMTVENLLVFRLVQFVQKFKMEHPLVESAHGIRVPSIGEFERIKHHLLNSFRDALINIYEARKYKYYGDKFPNILFTLHYFDMLLPNVKYIVTKKADFEYCLRSCLTQPWSERFNITRGSYKDRWDRGMALIDKIKDQKNVYILDHDLFCKEPKAEMDKVAKFLGIGNKFDVSRVIRE